MLFHFTKSKTHERTANRLITSTVDEEEVIIREKGLPSTRIRPLTSFEINPKLDSGGADRGPHFCGEEMGIDLSKTENFLPQTDGES